MFSHVAVCEPSANFGGPNASLTGVSVDGTRLVVDSTMCRDCDMCLDCC